MSRRTHGSRADVLVVGLGATAGLRAADAALVASLERAGVAVARVDAARPREVRTFALTDLGWAVSARRAAEAGLRRHRPRAVVYSSSTAAAMWPVPGAIRFDALAAANRPGRHGPWQRSLEARRLREASLLLPWDLASLAGAPADHAPALTVPVPVDPSGPPAPVRDIAAITYGANPEKKGLDRVLAAFQAAALPGEELWVTGTREVAARDGVRVTGPLAPDAYRALLRRARVFVTAPRREDHGIAQLEALADGCRLVTTPAPGPYAALALARRLDPRLVPEPGGLPQALRHALDAGPEDDHYARRAAELVAPFATQAVDRVVAEQLLPRLLG